MIKLSRLWNSIINCYLIVFLKSLLRFSSFKFLLDENTRNKQESNENQTKTKITPGGNIMVWYLLLELLI